MSNETLTCTVCDGDWTRERKRGRKPKICPSCSPSDKVEKAPKAKAKKKVVDTITPAQAAADRREFLKPDRQIVTKLPSDNPDHEYTSWWCESKVPMHKTCQSINNDACICVCHEV